MSFVAINDDLQNFSIPSGYSVSNNGIEKVAGESMITVCRRLVIIKSKTFSVDEKIYKLILAYANGLGRTKVNKDSTLRKLQDWRTIAIMTGETQLLADNVTDGANTRLLSINVTREILPADVCRLIHDTIKENHGLAFPLVIDKIFQLGFETLRQAYQDLVNLFTAKYPELLNEYCRYIAVLTLADTVLNAALNDANTFHLDDSIQNANAIFKLIPTTIEISDTAREKDFVLAIIAQNQNRFIGGNVPLDQMQTISGNSMINDGYTYISAKFLQDECSRDISLKLLLTEAGVIWLRDFPSAFLVFL